MTNEGTYQERTTPRQAKAPARASDATLTKLKDAILYDGIRAFRLFVDMLYPEDERGRRVALLHEVIDDDQEEWQFLEEAFRMSALVKQGVIQPDSHTEKFDKNVDGAQDRLRELRAKFSDIARARITAAGR